METLSPAQVRAARALLAWSQADLARHAHVGVSTVADYERAARVPVANNVQAIRDALEAQGLEFHAGGVVSKAMLPPAPPENRPGGLLRWVNATHLAHWGESRAGQGGMPEVLSRLIYATAGPAAALRFPSDDSVQQPGWDGVCEITQGGGRVPSGTSVWEIGAQRKGVRGKADEDFSKRTENPLGYDPRETTFVFVTPQRFASKGAWVAEKRALGLWRDVVALDADDLVHWLEVCPAVAQWLAVRIGRRPKALRNLEEAWEEWSSATTTVLTADLILTGRDNEQTEILRWLREGPSQFSVQAEAPDEAIAFLAAALHPLPEPHRLSYLGRCVVADTVETARDLVGLGTPLIIVLIEPDPGVAQRLVADGHHVYGAYGPDAAAINIRRLPRPWRHDLESALVALGVAEAEAHRLAHACGRSLTVLRRVMPAAPQYRSAWAAQPTPELFAALFAGSWLDHSVRDRQVLSELAGRPYEGVVAALAPLADLGGPLVRAGELWKVVSLRDLWSQIGRQVTSVQLDRFEAAFAQVLGATNPRFERRAKSRFYEEPGEFGEEASEPLRHGLSEAMIALAVYPDFADAALHLERRASTAVRSLLSGASPALWWSLSRDFRNLAEAAPETFLDALEEALEGANPPVASLFRSDEGFLHAREYLSNLLWALEMLARSPVHLTRVALVLARLDEIDPGGEWSNRPKASLRKIFVTWSPQTYATAEQRLKVIDRVVERYPEAGWRLLVKLAPRTNDTSEPSPNPNWRDFSTDEPEVLTWQSLFASKRAIGDRLLVHAGREVGRWIAVIDLWGNFDQEWRQTAAAQLETVARQIDDPRDAEALRDKLRQTVQRHRGFSDAQWAMPEESLQPLDAIIALLQPSDAVGRLRWLFRPGATALSPKMDWKAQHESLRAEQSAAATILLGELSVDAMFAFAQTVTEQRQLGVAVACAAAPEEMKAELLRRGLTASDEPAAELGVGVLHGLAAKADDSVAWSRDLWRRAIEEGWGEAAELRIVLRLPATNDTWTAIEARSESLAQRYWRDLPIFWVDMEPSTNVAAVVERLSAVGRARKAVAWLGAHLDRAPPSAVLIAALRAAARSEEALEGNDATMFSHYIGQILTRLDADPEVDEAILVELEWVYFSALEHSERPAKTLDKAIARDPSFFVQLLKLIYLPATKPDLDDSPDEMAMERTPRIAELASQAFDVLHHSRAVPGGDDAGKIDGAALDAWVKDARKLLQAADRADIGDSKIGELLAGARREPGEPWPPAPVRDVIEWARSRILESGFEVGVYNHRGVTVRAPYDGGEQERDEAARYRQDAAALRFDWPRTAACLERIAETYERDATRQDLSVQQRDWL